MQTGISKKNIVINTIPLLSPLTGIGRYTYEIAKNLKDVDRINEYTYYYGYYSRNLFYTKSEKGPSFKIKGLIKKIPGLMPLARSFKDLIPIITTRRFDIYFEPNFIPLRIRANRVIVAVHDFSFALYPEWHPGERIHYFKKNFWKKIKSADTIIVYSNFIKKSAVDLFNIPEERIRTIYHGFDRKTFRVYSRDELSPVKEKYRLPENFILYAGSIEPRKNLVNLILAYLSLDGNIRSKYKLVLAGFSGWKNKEIMDLIRGEEPDVTYLGYIPDEDLARIYNLSSVFVFPSFYEGFGLPPLEAMACGCPVITSNTSSLPEVCGDAAYYIDPWSRESIAEAIHRIITDENLRKHLIERGTERSRLFSWEKSARELLDIFMT